MAAHAGPIKCSAVVAVAMTLFMTFYFAQITLHRCQVTSLHHSMQWHVLTGWGHSMRLTTRERNKRHTFTLGCPGSSLASPPCHLVTCVSHVTCSIRAGREAVWAGTAEWYLAPGVQQWICFRGCWGSPAPPTSRPPSSKPWSGTPQHSVAHDACRLLRYA